MEECGLKHDPIREIHEPLERDGEGSKTIISDDDGVYTDMMPNKSQIYFIMLTSADPTYDSSKITITDNVDGQQPAR